MPACPATVRSARVKLAIPRLHESMMRNTVKHLESFIFASRWIQAPLYIGLIVAQVVYCWLFMVELSHLVTGAFGPKHMTETD